MKNLKKQDYLLLATGHSLALQSSYKPEIFHELADHMVQEIGGGYLGVSHVLEDLCDAYEKLGYMFYAKRTINELDLGIPYYALVVQYHTLSFLFLCKGFIDSISNAVFHAFDLDIKKAANIDIARPEFNRKLAKKNPQMSKRMKQFLDWAKYICDYRMALIHKYRFFGMGKAPTVTELEILREPISPLNFLDKRNLDTFTEELKKKYGSPMVQVEDFCREHLDNAIRLFEMVVSAFLEEIRRKGLDVFGFERIQPAHVGSVE